MRVLIAALLVAATAQAADKPAAVQLCVQLPEGQALFSDTPRPYMRSLGNDTWMLDLELTLNGHAVERITKSSGDCLRAWLPAEKLTVAKLDFSRLPLNLVTVEQPLNLQLKADLWSDGGKVTVTRAPWATAKSHVEGELVLERAGVQMKDLEALPAGPYVLKFTPAPGPKHACAITLDVEAVGTVRPDRNAEAYRALVEMYRADFLPLLIERNRLQCEEAEAAQVRVELIDGIFRAPLSPVVARVRLEEKEPHYLVSVDGQVQPFVDGMALSIQPGQQLELSRETLSAAR